MIHGPSTDLADTGSGIRDRGRSILGMAVGMGSIGRTGPYLHHHPHCPSLPSAEWTLAADLTQRNEA